MKLLTKWRKPIVYKKVPLQLLVVSVYIISFLNILISPPWGPCAILCIVLCPAPFHAHGEKWCRWICIEPSPCHWGMHDIENFRYVWIKNANKINIPFNLGTQGYIGYKCAHTQSLLCFMPMQSCDFIHASVSDCHTLLATRATWALYTFIQTTSLCERKRGLGMIPIYSPTSIIWTRDAKKILGQCTHCDHVTGVHMRSKPTGLELTFDNRTISA